MTDFIGLYTTHTKAGTSGHKIIYEEKMQKILQPLKNLIDINLSYRVFNLKYCEAADK